MWRRQWHDPRQEDRAAAAGHSGGAPDEGLFRRPCDAGLPQLPGVVQRRHDRRRAANPVGQRNQQRRKRHGPRPSAWCDGVDDCRPGQGRQHSRRLVRPHGSQYAESQLLRVIRHRGGGGVDRRLAGHGVGQQGQADGRRDQRRPCRRQHEDLQGRRSQRHYREVHAGQAIRHAGRDCRQRQGRDGACPDGPQVPDRRRPCRQ